MTTQTTSYSKALAACAAFWRGEQTGPLVTVVAEPSYRQLFDHANPNLESVADAAVAAIQADAASGEAYVVPTLYADFGTISTAKLYGGTVIPPPENGNVHIEPVVRNPDDLASLQACPFEASDFQLAIDLYHLVCDRLGEDKLYLRTPDFQGPMNTLALVMDQQELLMGMYTEPDAIHAALDSITSTLIAYHLRLRRELGGGQIIGGIWPYTFLPEDMGAAITQDMMPLLGPDLYRDFELPCLRRIADALGGLQIHCCGRYAQHLRNLKESGIPILGLEFHHPFTAFTEIHHVFGDDIVYIPFLFGECQDYADHDAFAADLLRQGTAETRFWFARTSDAGNVATLRDTIARVRAGSDPRT